MKRGETFFRTKVEIADWDIPMEVTDRCVFLGSCFAQEMGARFVNYGLRATANPLGVLYNPESIGLQVRQALHAGESRPPVFEARDGWHSWWAGTAIVGRTADECMHAAGNALQCLGEALADARHVFFTLGSNVRYVLKSDGRAVANCHRMPQSLFREERMDVDCCVDLLSGAVEEILSANPSCHVVFTVSPFRYTKYTFHGSRLAKAALLLAVDEVVRKYPGTADYFPAYEIVLDELRDYRFYEADMIHPSAEAVDYIWTCLQECAMSDAMRRYITEYEPIRRGLAHRPSDPGSDGYALFLRGLEEKRSALRQKYSLQ